ncbi:MAG: N-6 DNA methylase [Leucobacter sp.]
MKSELAQVQGVASDLRALGYPLVQTQVRIPTAARHQVDVLAWAADDAGELAPRLVVEVKGGGQRPETVLPQLAQISSALGTEEHFVVVSDEWFYAGRGFRSIDSTDGPPAAGRRASGEVRSVALAAQLLHERVWHLADAHRNERGVDLSTFVDAVKGDDDQQLTIETVAGDRVDVESRVLWKARRRVLTDLADSMKSMGIFVSPPVVAEAIALLVGKRLGGRALDPFCGSGSFLWALHDRAQLEGASLETLGRDLTPEVIRAASMVGSSIGGTATFEVDDAFATSLPEADIVVTAPPMGLRLPAPFELMNGRMTKDSEVAAVDQCLRALKPGGRAVLQLSPSITVQTQLESYRDFLATEYRIAALIGCPSGAAYATQVSTVLMVIDRAPADTTFVAQLADDWQTQLGPTGPVMSAAREHIDGAS